MTRRISALDPRAGIWLLLLANIGMFCEKYAWQGIAISSMLLLLLLLYRQYAAAWKGAALIVVFRLLLKFVFPLCPRLINMVFPVLINYTLRMMPCILAGILLVRNASMQKMIAAMRALHLPQGFITAISTTLRYFPAIKDEFGHIRAAAKLQNIPLSGMLEATVVPIMMSAVNTSDEIAAAAVVRGIENPCKKTSYIRLRITVSDWLIMALATLCMATTIWMGYRL